MHSCLLCKEAAAVGSVGSNTFALFGGKPERGIGILVSQSGDLQVLAAAGIGQTNSARNLLQC